MNKKANLLHVLYTYPYRLPPFDALILSFMPPDQEDRFSKDNYRFLFARKEMGSVREKARKAYIDLIARIGATPCNGRTLRQALQTKNRGNPWWYHKISEKDVESEDTLSMLLQIFTILYVAEKEHINHIAVYGSPVEIASVLSTRYQVKKINCISSRKNILGKCLLSRLKYLCWVLYAHNVIKNNISLSKIEPEIVFQGFWDWSIKVNGESKKLKDNYFKLLPDNLLDKGISCAWFLWLDPYPKSGSNFRPLNKVLKPALDNDSLIFVQKFLKLNDIFLAIFDFRTFWKYLNHARLKEFKNIFKIERCDLLPLIKDNLFYYFCDASIPGYFLMETAYQRAFYFFKPRISFTFTDLFLSSRAFNQGAKLGNPQTIKCNMQHASYSREKAFILMDADREYQGKPDNNPIPAPDYFFVMGELVRDILIECGFPREKIFVTGSARYDYIKLEDRGLLKDEGCDSVKVLLVSTLNVKLDFEMVAAAFLAAKGLNISLYIRSHPYGRMENTRLYKRFSDFITSSDKSLDDDLNSADLILFSYSTVAEEAFLKGVPIIQWQPSRFNGSVFRDLKGIPVVRSVDELKETFCSFLENPLAFKPKREHQELVLRKCFFKADGQASCRIAQKTAEMLR